MSFRGLEFIRQWVTEHIYRARIKGSDPGLRSSLRRP